MVAVTESSVMRAEMEEIEKYFGIPAADDEKDDEMGSANRKDDEMGSNDEMGPDQPQRLALAWARVAEAVLDEYGLGIKGVDGSRVFFHIPSKAMSVKRQKQALITAGVYHALDICWEPSCYASEHGASPGECWWVPREWFKRVSPLAASIADEDAIAIPGDRPAHEYEQRQSLTSGIWDRVRSGDVKDPWKGFFVTQADFDTYNHNGMKSEDPNAHRWSSAKLLFDYTPYVTTSDWRQALEDNRWMWQNLRPECEAKKEPQSE